MGRYLKACKCGRELKFNPRKISTRYFLGNEYSTCFTFYIPANKGKDNCERIFVSKSCDLRDACQKLAFICERKGYGKVFISKDEIESYIKDGLACEENFCRVFLKDGSEKFLNTFKIRYLLTAKMTFIDFNTPVKFFRDCPYKRLVDSDEFSCPVERSNRYLSESPDARREYACESLYKYDEFEKRVKNKFIKKH